MSTLWQKKKRKNLPPSFFFIIFNCFPFFIFWLKLSLHYFWSLPGFHTKRWSVNNKLSRVNSVMTCSFWISDESVCLCLIPSLHVSSCHWAFVVPRLWFCSSVPAAPGREQQPGCVCHSQLMQTLIGCWLPAGLHAPPPPLLSESCPCCACCSVSAESLCALGLRVWSCVQEDIGDIQALRGRKVEAHFASFSLFTRGNTITRSGDEEETSLWHLTGRPSIPNSMRCSYGRQG